MNTLPKARSSGFSLVELIIGVAILSIVMGIAAPTFFQWARSLQVKNAAGSIASGIQRARAEAVARNTNVIFVLSSDTSWTVTEVATSATIATRAANEGAQNNTTRIRTPSNSSGITFNNYGIAVPNADGLPTYAQIDLAAAGTTRNMRVTIGVGGNAKVCDPNLPSGSNASAC